MAAGGARAGQHAVGPGRPRYPAPALQVGRLGRDQARRLAAARRRVAGLPAAADGAPWTGVPRLSEFPGLSAVEPVAELLPDGRVSRHALRRRTADEPRQPADPRAVGRA